MTGKIKNKATLSKEVNGEFRKTKNKLTLILTDIISIREFTEEKVSFLTHSGEIEIVGDKVSFSLFKEKTVEVVGKINEVTFKYAKN